MDAVYALGSGSRWRDNELRYSLRSLALYVPEVTRVVIVGRRPVWLRDVLHINHPDRHRCKEKNIMDKVRRACADRTVSDRFLFVNDDHFALGPQSATVPNYATRDLTALERAVRGGNPYRRAVVQTVAALRAGGHTCYNYDVHLPIVYDKHLFPRVMAGYDWERGCYVVKSLYGNTLGLQPTWQSDLKIGRPHGMRELVRLLRGRPWFSLGDAGLNMALKELLLALYNEPSRWERT